MTRRVPHIVWMSLCCVFATTSCDCDSAIQSGWSLDDDGGLLADAGDTSFDTDCNEPPIVSPRMLPHDNFALPQHGASDPVVSEGIVYYARSVGDDSSRGAFDAVGVDASTHVDIPLTNSSADDAVEVDTVGAPCLCCGAMWPSLSLHLDDNVLAWNYSLFDGETRTRGAGYAYATVERGDGCKVRE
jgi:hypothetical protein